MWLELCLAKHWGALGKPYALEVSELLSHLLQGLCPTEKIQLLTPEVSFFKIKIYFIHLKVRVTETNMHHLYNGDGLGWANLHLA